MPGPPVGPTLSARRRRPLLWALPVALMAHGASAQDRVRWGDITLSVDAVALLPSEYGTALLAFDHEAPGWAFSTALRVAKAVTPWFQLGGRLGWLRTASGVAPLGSTPPVPTDGPIDFEVVDVGGLMRVAATPPRGGVRVHFDLEAGAALGNVTLLQVTQRWVRPRFGVGMFTGYRSREGMALFGVRMGFQYVPWGGANGSAFDPVFSGFYVGLEGGLSP